MEAQSSEFNILFLLRVLFATLGYKIFNFRKINMMIHFTKVLLKNNLYRKSAAMELTSGENESVFRKEREARKLNFGN